MDADRSIPRRRFVSLAGPLCLAALAGCTDEKEADENETEGGDENESGGGAENGTTAGDENESAVVDEEEELPEIEGTNVFIEVVDEGDVPVPGATVIVTGGAYDEREFETDASGTVILQDVEPGDYLIVATTEAGEDEAEISVAEGEDANVSLAVPVAMEEDEDEDGPDGDANETDADDA